MCSITRIILLSVLALVLSGCDDVRSSTNGGFTVEKKYFLIDCMVRLDFEWDKETNSIARLNILKKIDDQVSQAIASGNFPLFSGHYLPRDTSYYVFYFADDCEQRRQLIQKLIDEYFMPNVLDFPRYKIVHEDVKPGFDGVVPRGWWKVIKR